MRTYSGFCTCLSLAGINPYKGLIHIVVCRLVSVDSSKCFRNKQFGLHFIPTTLRGVKGGYQPKPPSLGQLPAPGYLLSGRQQPGQLSDTVCTSLHATYENVQSSPTSSSQPNGYYINYKSCYLAGINPVKQFGLHFIPTTLRNFWKYKILTDLISPDTYNSFLLISYNTYNPVLYNLT